MKFRQLNAGALFIIILFSIVSSLSYGQDAKEELILKSALGFAHIDSPIEIEVEGSSVLRQAKDVSWEATSGSIKALSLSKALFDPKGRAGEAKVSVTAVDHDGKEYKGEITITAFKQFAMIKADDLGNAPNLAFEPFSQLYEVVKKNNIKASMGLVGKSLDLSTDGLSAGQLNFYKSYFHHLTHWHQSGLVEIWNHGYDHYCNNKKDNDWEFKNRTAKLQEEHLRRTQELAKEKLGITLKAFGAPCGFVDENTTHALEAVNEINILIWNESLKTSKFILPETKRINLEHKAGYPDFQYFRENYREDLDYMVIVIHPWIWKDDAWGEFEQMINFLKERDVKFVIPSEIPDLFAYKIER